MPMTNADLYYPGKRRGSKHGTGRRVSITGSLRPDDFAAFAKYQNESRRLVAEIIETAVNEYIAKVTSQVSESN